MIFSPPFALISAPVVFFLVFFPSGCMQIVARAQVTVLAGLVRCSVQFFTGLILGSAVTPPFLLSLIRALSPAADVCLFCTGFMSNSEVRVGDDGDEVILFLCLSMHVEA